MAPLIRTKDGWISLAEGMPCKLNGKRLALCSGDDAVIPPQCLGGMSGAGIPDLARRTPGGILQVAETNPAEIECLVDGEEQLLRYIDQGNAHDPAQVV